MKLLAYDGSFSGFISLIYFCITKGIKPDYIFKFNNLPGLSVTKIKNLNIPLITKYLTSKLGKDELQNIYYAYLSEIENIESFIISYIFYRINNGYNSKINMMFQKIVKNVLYEISDLSTNLIFSKVNNILFAKIKPYNNVIFPLSNYFSRKLPRETWIIYDVMRSSAILHLNRKNLMLNNVNFKIETKSDFVTHLWENIIRGKKIS
ncbi:MAG: DUF4130 domain-containing protein [Thermosipho sp. (in: Bacteria)]|nr:DUF4130 domain-containing protein [Thermosipho sp. (in: thermotogales)]